MRKLLLITVMTLLISGCAKEASLNEDVDLLAPTATPELGTRDEGLEARPTPLVTANPATVSAVPAETIVDLKTSKGVIKLQLFPDKAPKTVQNFLAKAKSGYYAGLTFHRVEDWVIQGGDPQGTGRGGGTMPTELSQEPFTVGSLGVARGGDIKVSNDSQFFICKNDCSWLTGQYTIFGKVLSGMETVNQIAIGDKIVGIVEEK